MTELKDDELVELQKASDASSITGISAMTTRLLNQIAGTLDGTKAIKPFGIVVSVDKSSIDNIADVVTKTLQPQITAATTDIQTLTGQTSANTADLATAKTNIQTVTAQTGANTADLATAKANIQTLNGQTGANTADLATANANIQTLTGQTGANTADLATAKANIQTLSGQTGANTTDLATAKANIQALTEQTSTNTTGLATAQTNIHSLKVDIQANKDGLVAARQELNDRVHHTQEQLRRLEEAVEKRWPEIRAELVGLIETGRREQRDTIAEIQATILRNQAHSAAPEAATPHTENPRPPRGSGHR
jgi:chromosome segregation ATPase